MPDVSGPFDGVNYYQAPYYRDRGYLEPSGVQGTPAATAGTGDLAYTTAGLTGSLALGRGRVRGASYERTGTAWTYAHPANTDPAYSRIDRVVLRRDLAAKTVVPAVLQGTPAATPAGVAPTTVEDGVWEEMLHDVTVPPNSGTVLTVTDQRKWIGPRGSGVIAFATEAIANARGSVLAGLLVQAADTGAVGLWDAGAARMVWWDTRWQTYTPNLATTNATNYWTQGSGGTAIGRYFRKGRHVSVEGVLKIGTGTAFGGAGAGTVLVTYPPGYAPAYWTTPDTTFAAVIGVCQVYGGSFGNGFVGINGINGATPRFAFYTAAAVAVTGTGTGWNMSASGHGVQFSAEYETAFGS